MEETTKGAEKEAMEEAKRGSDMKANAPSKEYTSDETIESKNYGAPSSLKVSAESVWGQCGVSVQSVWGWSEAWKNN